MDAINADMKRERSKYVEEHMDALRYRKLVKIIKASDDLYLIECKGNGCDSVLLGGPMDEYVEDDDDAWNSKKSLCPKCIPSAAAAEEEENKE